MDAIGATVVFLVSIIALIADWFFNLRQKGGKL